MALDWQTITVALLILAALVYVGRRGVSRLRAFNTAKADAASCETGCGSCEASPSKPAAQLKTLVQLERSSTRR